MKSVKLVLTLALLACLVATTALAGVAGGKGANTVQSNGRGVEVYGLKESDIPADRIQKSSAPVRVSEALSNPQPEPFNAASLAKYPNISAAGLSGTYSIGVGGDFADLPSAAAVLNFVGLAGDVVFELINTSYESGTVTIGGAYAGAGTYTVTIAPAAGVDVTYDFMTSATNGKGIVLNGAKGVIVGSSDANDHLTLGIGAGYPFPIDDPMGSTIYMTGVCEDITVQHATVKGVVNDPVWENQTEGRSCVFIFSADGDDPSSGLTFEDVTFISGTIGLKLFPEVPQVTVENMTVNNCKFGGAFGGRLIIGSWLEYGARVTFTNNQFKDLYWIDWYWNNEATEYVEDVAFGVGDIYYNLGQMTAWHHLAVDGGTYAYNVIDGMSGDYSPATISYGTRTFGANNGYAAPHEVQFHHNRMQNIFLDHPSQSLTAIRGGTGHYYHNTIRLTGTKTLSTTWTSTCLNGSTTAYNNVFSNEILPAGSSTVRGVTAGGTIDYNAIYSSGVPVTGQTTVAGAVTAGVNPNGLYGPVGTFSADLHITGGSSTAKEIGKPFVSVGPDIDGNPIDSTFAGKRDAGAHQFSPLGTYAGIDALPGAITSPPAGVPVGVPQTPAVSIKNNSQAPASVSVTLTATGGYTDTKVVSLNAGQTKSQTFAAWTPASAGPYTFTATTTIGGDVTPGNDVLLKTVTASSPVAPPPIYTFDASAEGWTGTCDWIRSNSFTKLGGVNGGSGYSWVAVRGGAATSGVGAPYDKSTYTEGAYASSQGYATTYPGANLLTSPWLDISGFASTDLYIGFQHSIETEPLWDRSWLQYTVDGITWTTIGVLNEPNGINWYNENLYEHAALDEENIDEATLALYGLAAPAASWTSNDNGTTGAPGDFVPNGPTGYVYSQIKVTETTHAALVGASAVRFRYVAFSDAVSSFGGWAFDNFRLSGSPFVFTGGTIAGHAWQDQNGDGLDVGEPDYTNTKVYISLFGSVIDSVLTNGTGDYTWSGVSLPAAYDLRLNVTGVAYTVPYGVSGIATVNHGADGTTKTQNFGTFVGGISGVVYSDAANNGTKDPGDLGLPGWTVEVHKDSINGLLMGSDISDANGDWGVLLPPGTFVASEVAQPAVARKTEPTAAGYTFTVDNGTPAHLGKNFGNFILARLRVSLTVDQDGQGDVDPGDVIAVPSGFTSTFTVKKYGVNLTGSPFTLGNGTIAAQFASMDTGTYVVTEVDSTPGWRRTKGGSYTFVVNASAEAETAKYLDFKYLVITGTKFNDLNANGVKDGGELGLPNWTINVSGGSYYGSTTATTDANGEYTIDSVFTGTHTVAEVAQAGWTLTAPAGGTYTINGISGNLVNTTGKNFGNFDNSDISGIVYRDYNGNGAKDPEDVVVSDVTVGLAVNGGSDVTDGAGYSFNGVLTVDTVRITVPAGFTITQPAAGEYPVALLSGGAATGLNFGLFQTTDSSKKYRTFTVAQLSADDQAKPAKTPKAGKPYDPVKNNPNTANLVDQLLNPKTGTAPGSVFVGKAGQLNIGGKEKCWVQPNKQSAFFGSLNNKGGKHNGMARGFDQDLKGKPILKLQKAFAPNKKQDNNLFAELLVLKLNLVASGSKTPAGLGSLIYSDANSSFDGWTIDEISDYADEVMTNYEFVGLDVYTGLDSVAAYINGAFYHPETNDTATGWAFPTMTWKAYTSVYDVERLKPNPGVAPKNRRVAEVEAVPTAFALSQNYPNPFNPTTTIEFDLPEASIVTLKVYNLLGQEVATLLNKEEMEFSETVEFDASSLPSGVYLYRIVAETIADEDAGVAAETFTQVKKMVLVK